MIDASDREKTEGRMAYIDLLVETLNQHEKTLDELILRLERSLVSDNRGRPKKHENVTYTKIEIPYNRPIKELITILETLTSKKQ